MGLRDTFKNAAKTAITAAGDIAESAYYYSQGSAVYNVSTGAVSIIDSRYLLSGIFSQYNGREIDNNNIKPQDMKLSLAQTDFTPNPHPDDYIIRIENNVSTKYEIVDIKQDAAGALWNFQLRKP